MNEIIEFAEIQKRRRAEKIAEICKEINTWTILIFFIMLGLHIIGTIPEFMMYAYIIVGTIVLIASTMTLVFQMVKADEDEYDYEEEKDEYDFEDGEY